MSVTAALWPSANDLNIPQMGVSLNVSSRCVADLGFSRLLTLNFVFLFGHLSVADFATQECGDINPSNSPERCLHQNEEGFGGTP